MIIDCTHIVPVKFNHFLTVPNEPNERKMGTG